MFTTFLITIKVLIRDRSVLLWAVAFPLVLTTLFYTMFFNLDDVYKLKPIPVVVVNDSSYQSEGAASFRELVDALAADDAYDGSPLLRAHYVSDEAAARTEMEGGDYYGYLLVDKTGAPTYYQDGRHVDNLSDPSQSIIRSILDQYVQTSGLITQIAQENPRLFADPAFVQQLVASVDESYTERLQITANPPSDALRYFYAVLAFSTIMMSSCALTAIDLLQGNTSPLGARRSLGGQSKLRTLIPTLGASWLLSFACVFIGFLYQRFVFGIDFGGKEPAVLLILAIGTLSFTFLGALFGSLPLREGLKGGFVAVASCFLSLFAGLYGPFAQQLGDLVARELPALSAANPVRQIADAFFSLYYYDSYEVMMQNLAFLLAFGAVCFVGSTLILRRQRYASL